MLDECAVEPLDFVRRAGSLFGRQSSLDHALGAAADHVACRLERHGRDALASEHDIERIDEIGCGIDQRSVQIKDHDRCRHAPWLPGPAGYGKSAAASSS